MVRKGTNMDEFDAIRFEQIVSKGILIGASSETQHVEIELYQKSLVLTEKWDKLPVLEKINMNPAPAVTIASGMEASGLNVMNASVGIYNCEYDDIDEDHLIDSYSLIISQDTGVLYVFNLDHKEADFNIPLRNKITLVFEMFGNQNVAGTNLPAALLRMNFFFNIDWRKMSAEELKNWILKEVFIDS